MHENIGGDAEQHVTHVKIVMPKDKLDRFLETCGFHRNGLQRGFDHRELAPNQPLFWWDPPDRQLVYGDSREDEGFAIAVVVLERDTDFSVYVHATGSLP